MAGGVHPSDHFLSQGPVRASRKCSGSGDGEATSCIQDGQKTSEGTEDRGEAEQFEGSQELSRPESRKDPWLR